MSYCLDAEFWDQINNLCERIADDQQIDGNEDFVEIMSMIELAKSMLLIIKSYLNRPELLDISMSETELKQISQSLTKLNDLTNLQPSLSGKTKE